MSWRASAYIKSVSTTPNGERLSRSEKLVLLCLADSYNDDEKAAWPSIKKLAEAAMLSTRRTQELLRNIERKGLLKIESRTRDDGGTGANRYHFPGLEGEGAKNAGGAGTRRGEGAGIRTRGCETVVSTHNTEQEVNGGEPTPALAASPNPNPALQTYVDAYGALPNLFAQGRIESEVKDVVVWGRVVVRLRTNGTPPKNVGTLLDAYVDEVAKAATFSRGSPPGKPLPVSTETSEEKQARLARLAQQQAQQRTA